MDPRTRKRLLNVVRVVICAAALAFVVWGVTLHDHVALRDGSADLVGRILSDGDPVEIRLLDGRVRNVPRAEVAVDEDGGARIAFGLQSAWSNSRKDLLVYAVLLNFLVVFPLALRFQRLLAVQQISLGFWECVKLSLAGNFLNFATPFGSNAGDVFKAYFASLHTERKTEAVATVVLDRIIGLGSLVLVVALITLVDRGNNRLAMLRPYMLGLLVLGVVGAAAYFAPPLRGLWTRSRWIARLPMADQLKRLDRAAHTLASHGWAVATSILISVFLQAMCLVGYFAVAVALAFDAHAGNVLEYFAYFYTGALVQSLPGPPQGLGTVELTYRYFFAPYGSPSQILCMAFAIRFVVLVSALPGLLVTATGAYRPKAADLDSITTEPPVDPLATKRDWGRT